MSIVMDNKDYIKNVLKTESVDFEAIKERFSDPKVIRGLHAAIGIVTEAGELIDVFKKHLFYGKPIDWVNLEEEQGDLFWYMGVMADVLGKEDFEPMQEKNINKLAKRYPNQVFTSNSAINRNVQAERKILEKADDAIEVSDLIVVPTN